MVMCCFKEDWKIALGERFSMNERNYGYRNACLTVWKRAWTVFLLSILLVLYTSVNAYHKLNL